MKTKELELISKAYHTLNQIPNQSSVGPGGESSYEIASELSKYLEEHTKSIAPKYTTRFLFLNDHNGHEGDDPVADLVDVETPIDDIEKTCDTIMEAEFSQLGVSRLGGSWRMALERAEYPYKIINQGRQSDFDDCDYSVEYKVVSGNY